MVIASGRSTRQVGAMAEHLAQKLREAGAARVSVEGMPQCDWVLIDGGDVIVIAGKGHEQGQEIAGVVHPFDDRAVARAALRRLGAGT